jgi:hypothetical protein
MRRRLLYCIRAALSVLALGAGAANAEDQTPLEYDRDVRPILSENCLPCHGQDPKKRMAGLRLDSFEGATADRGGHAALAPGRPEASALYQRITAAEPARRMPPVYSNRHLTADQIAILKRWIEDGGKYTRHWSFIRPKRPPVPAVADRSWVKQPIDAFVLRRLETEKLKPGPAAGPQVWLRRVSLSLTGIPPTIAEYDAFAHDVKARGEAAFSAAADRLLASPRYGERMAMDWLDVAHYADTHGFNNDSERSMWRWRDWVIDAFNANLPYNRFLTEQLAGDLLPHPSLSQRIATGFGRNHVINSEGGIIEEEYRVEYVADRVRTLGMAWLGLTLECAHCHDHKFDPITQRDHYRFFAFFNNVPELGEDGRVANAVPMIPAPTAEQQQRARILDAAIARLQAKIDLSRKSWHPDPAALERSLHDLTPVQPPAGTTLYLPCESITDFAKPPETGFIVPDGISGHSCQIQGDGGQPLAAGAPTPIWKRGPMTFSLWIRPDAAGGSGALLSDMDYATNTASTGYGKGIELRQEGGELEFRFADRFPAYSVRVRSEGAGIAPGRWTHLALVYEGVGGRDVLRVHASWIRMFADGRELPVRVLNDGLSLPDDKSKPATTRFRIGWDTMPGGPRFKGRLDEIAVWSRALAPAEIEGLFESRAIPYAVERQRLGEAAPGEIEWLRDAALRRSDAVFANQCDELEGLRAESLAIQRNAPTLMVMEEMAEPRDTHILLRGAYNAPGDKVEPGVPEDLLGAWPAGAPRNRLGLARWLTQPDHPLTARVVVNRFWQQLFGQGLVKTSDNFGMQGEWPSHPELLDWLAREFIESGWNVKSLLKGIVLSATFRQDSAASPDLIARDPENRLLARGPRFRLPAEILRDQALAVSGLLKNHLGGPSVYPYQAEGLYKGVVVDAPYPGTRYVVGKGDDLYRRSLYTFWKRTMPHPVMTVFDAPDREFCIVRRLPTNTPLQALTLLNNPTFVEAARKLAERAIHEGGSSPDSRVEYAFRLATGRPPDAEERKILSARLEQMIAAYNADAGAARELIGVGESVSDAAIPSAELAAYTALANIILNMDEVITLG